MIRLCTAPPIQNGSPKGGVIRFYEKSHKEIFKSMSLKKFKTEISDHLPLWIEVDTWIEGEQLDAIIKGAADPD